MSDRDIFQENLIHFLETRGKTQKDLAEYVGVTKSTVSGWIHGVSYPRADAMEQICNYFGINLSKLVESRSREEAFADSLSFEECQLVTAYRKADSGTQASVRKLLDIPEEKSEAVPAV